MIGRRGFLLGLFGSAIAVKAKAGMVVQPSRFAAGGGGPAGPIPSFRSVGTVDGANAAGGTIAPGLPTGWQQNDIFILLVECNNADTVPAPSGWTQVTGSPQGNAGGTTSKLAVFWKRAGATESAPAVTRVGDHTMGIILAFSGCVTSGDPIDASTGTNGSGGSITIPGITTTGANRLVVDCVSTGTDSSVGSRFSAWANADLATPSITECSGSDVCNSAGGGGGVAASAGGRATAGTVGNTTVTGPGDQWGAVKLALKPT